MAVGQLYPPLGGGIHSLEWFGRLVHLVLFTVAKEKSGDSDSVGIGPSSRGDGCSKLFNWGAARTSSPHSLFLVLQYLG